MTPLARISRILKANRGIVDDYMKLLAIDNGTGSRFYRLIPQLKFMASKGHEVRMVAHNDPEFDKWILWSDTILFQMVFNPDTVKDVKRLGKKVIFECDDLIHSVPPTHYAYEETRGFKNQIKWWWRIWQVLRNCDGFICTTESLRKKYGWLAKKSLVFNNYLSLEHWMKEPKKNLDPNKIRLLWAGSTSHVGDLNWARPIIGTIMKKYPQVQFVYIGMGGASSKDLYTQFIYGEDFWEELPRDRRESILPVYPNVWPYILASLQADIAIAPLEDNYFNKHKSACKYLEYGINGIPGVYSKWFYKNMVKDGVTGFLADTKENWIEKLSTLIDGEKGCIIRDEISKNAREDVIKNHNILDYLPIWENFVKGIAGVDK